MLCADTCTIAELKIAFYYCTRKRYLASSLHRLCTLCVMCSSHGKLLTNFQGSHPWNIAIDVLLSPPSPLLLLKCSSCITQLSFCGRSRTLNSSPLLPQCEWAHCMKLWSAVHLAILWYIVVFQLGEGCEPRPPESHFWAAQEELEKDMENGCLICSPCFTPGEQMSHLNQHSRV